MKHQPYGPYERFVKRPQDFMCAVLATTVLSPVMLTIAVTVRIKLGSPVLFAQERPGLDGKVFRLYKFRTMTDDRDEKGELLPDADRLPAFGKKLRSTSLDELPELFNILKGDMAVVGPRPLLVRYLSRYNEHQARRHEVRPGFTGLAQVHGRNAISWEEKFDWDVRYVDHITFLGDWKIILETVKTVLKREGISNAGEATMAEFMGKDEGKGRKTMKVLILANNASGLFKFRRELLARLLQQYEVSFSVPKDEYADKISEMGCRYIPCDVLDGHGTNPLNELKLIKYYKTIVKKERPDAVLTYTIKPNVYGGFVCGKLGIPYIANITGLGTAVENKGILQTITVFLYRKGIKKAQKVFFQNKENMRFMIDHKMIKGPYDLLPGSGVNLTDFQVLPYPKKEEVDFVFVARVIKEKGIDQYLDAAAAIREKHPETRFHICGYLTDAYKEIIGSAAANGTVIYHGLVKDMKPIYEMASCIVHPTYYPEGLSNVLLEGSACGRPCITTDRSGCREVVDNGINGFLVKQKDSKDLIEKIESFLALPVEEREKMGQAGRKKVEREFSREIVIHKYIDELESISKKP